MSAQTPATPDSPDLSKARLRFGSLYLMPSIGLTNVGIDQNVFNEPDDLNPKKDYTATITPTADAWLRLGRTWLSGSVKEDVVWYQTYASERTVNYAYRANWRLPLSKIRLNLGTTHLHARERPGFEIDARSERSENGYDGSVEVRVTPKTFVGAIGSQLQVDYDKAAIFLGANLHDQLTHETTAAGITVRNQFTPLTSIAFTASRSQDRFQYSPLRDSDSTIGSLLVTLDPAALIKGSAAVGYRKFEPLSSGLPGFSGITALANLTYIPLSSTKFGVGITRDIQYSFDVNQPYYLQTGFNASISQRIFGPVDVVVRAGRQWLAYRERAGAFVQVSNRTDQMQTYGGGVGYRLGRDLRLGVNADKDMRVTDLAARRFNNLRIWTAVTYGQ